MTHNISYSFTTSKASMVLLKPLKLHDKTYTKRYKEIIPITKQNEIPTEEGSNQKNHDNHSIGGWISCLPPELYKILESQCCSS